MSTSLIHLFKGELFKGKREFGWYIMIFFPILIFGGLNAYILLKDLGNMTEPYTVNPWVYLLEQNIWAFYTLLYPVVISIFCFSLFDIEYKNNYIKKLFTLPVGIATVFKAKILLVIIMSFISSIFTYLLLILSAFILESLLPMTKLIFPIVRQYYQ